MKDLIRKFCSDLGIEVCGFAPNPKGEGTAVVCLFPYYSGGFGGDISIYAQGMDYHKVVRDYLSKVNRYVSEMVGDGYCGEIFCDISPYSDRSMAVSARLGVIGQNGCLINKKYGSFVFIGYILMNIQLDFDEPIVGGCGNCGECIKACPGSAIGNKRIDAEKCVSAITQKKGELSDVEVKTIRKSGYVWGCDICQKVCPHNKDIPITNLIEFKDDLIKNIDYDKINNLSGREFKDEFSSRAFAWRGKGVLIRNFNIYLNIFPHMK